PTRACQASLPISQSKALIWMSRRSGISNGSTILAKEMRPVGEMTLCFDVVVREAAKSGPSEGTRAMDCTLNDPCQAHGSTVCLGQRPRVVGPVGIVKSPGTRQQGGQPGHHSRFAAPARPSILMAGSTASMSHLRVSRAGPTAPTHGPPDCADSES